jgi:L-rhamnose mutarotase
MTEREPVLERICFAFALRPGMEEEYRRRHDAIWPEMTQLLESAGVTDYSIFSAGTRFTEGSLLVGALKADPDWQAASEILQASDVQRRWGEAMSDLIEWQLDADGKFFQLAEVFRLGESGQRAAPMDAGE